MKHLELLGVTSGTWNRPVSLALDRSEYLLLLGRNGAGKSTLLTTLAGLMPVKTGTVLLNGSDVTDLDELGRAPLGVRIALEGRHVFSRLSARANLLLGAYTERSKQERESRLDWVLGVFPDLKAKLNKAAGTLSGGQQTQLNIGRALMGKPEVLLLDEPALGLDPSNVRKLIDALFYIREERHVTAIIAEQGATFVSAFPGRLALMVGGEIAFDGTWTDAQAGHKLTMIFG